MKIRIISDVRSMAVAAALLCLVAVAPAVATTPQYQIYDIGIINTGDTASQGFGVSHAGVAVGRSIGTAGSQAFTWTLQRRHYWAAESCRAQLCRFEQRQ